jgi:uncharacterized iron-regulated membrane protein
MPDWLRTAVWIVGVLALLLTLVVGYMMWRYRIPPRGWSRWAERRCTSSPRST